MKKELDMTSGNLFKKILIYAIPLMLIGVLQRLYNSCDTMVIGKFAGNEALAAVGSTGSLIALITNLFFGVSVGISISYSKSLGMKDYERANNVIHTSFIVCIVFSAILMAIAIPLADKFLILMKSPDDVIELATLYVRVYFIGIFFSLLYSFFSAILIAHGDTKRPLLISIISGLINVSLNLVFVLVFKLSVLGVALATIISQAFSALCALIIMMKETGTLNFSFKKLRINFSCLKEMIIAGFASGIQGALFSISNVLAQKAVNEFGSIIIAGNSVAVHLEVIVYAIMYSFYQACLNFTSQNYGAGKKENIKKVFLYSLTYVFSFGAVFSILMLGFSPLILKLFSNDNEVISYAKLRLLYVLIPYFTFGIGDVTAASLRGMKSSLTPTIISLFSICALRIIWIETIFKSIHTITNLYISFSVTWLINFVLLFIARLIVYYKYNKKVSFC